MLDFIFFCGKCTMSAS